MSDAPSVPPAPSTSTAPTSKGKGYTVNASPEWTAALEKLAAHQGKSVPDLVAGLVTLDPADRAITCTKCKRTQTERCVFPELPQRPEGERLRTHLAVRIFGNRWIEVVKVAGAKTESGYVCSVCSTTTLKPLQIMFRHLMRDSDISELFGSDAETNGTWSWLEGLLGKKAAVLPRPALKALPPAVPPPAVLPLKK